MYSHVTTLSFTVIYEKIELLKGHLVSFVVSYHLFVFFNNANTVSAEMWVWGFGNHKWYKSLVKSRVADEWLDKRLLFHAWFPKPHTHISALTALALLKTTNKRYEITNEMRYLFERNEIFKHFGQCTHMWLHWLLQISNFTRQKNLWNWCWSKSMYSHVTTLTSTN